MTEFNFHDYMLDVASKLLALQHSTDKPCFTRASSLIKLEEFLGSIRDNTGFQLCILDTHTGRFNDAAQSDNLFDRQVYTFFIFRYVTLNNFEDRKNALVESKAIFHSILSKMFFDRMNFDFGLNNLERSSISYDTMGPIGNNCHGLMVHFTIKDFPLIKYDADYWIKAESESVKK